MRKLDGMDLLFAIAFLVVGLFLSPYIFRGFPSYEFHLNSTNPLVLGNNNFMLCKLPHSYYNFKAIWNSVNNKLDLKEYCKDSKYDDDLYSKYGRENIEIKNFQDIDDLFSGQEEKINTSKGIYYISKLREERIEKDFSYEIEIIIKVEDTTQEKKYFWQN